MEVDSQPIQAELKEGSTQVYLDPAAPKREVQIMGVPVGHDNLPDVLFKEELLKSDEQLHMTMFMAHFLLMYLESDCKTGIELPPGISHENRIIVHHIADKLGLGSFTRGTKGVNKKMVIAPMGYCPEKFEKAKKGRDTIISDAIKSYKFKTFNPPQVTVREETYKIVDEQVENRKKGLDFNKSWQQFIVSNDHEMKQYVESLADKESSNKTPDDGKDWSLSADGFNIYISGENKNVVNKDAYTDKEGDGYNSQFRGGLDQEPGSWSDDDYNIEGEADQDIAANEPMEDADYDGKLNRTDSNESNLEEEYKTNNIDPLNLAKMTLEDFKGRPDMITSLEITNVFHDSVEISWEVPDCNNAPITEYSVKCKEMDVSTMKETFKCIYRSETNSVTIEDLREDTWHTIDVRAVNSFGYCPQSSRLLGFKTLKSSKGNLYAWGSNKDAELCFSEEEVSENKFFLTEKTIAVAPIKVEAFTQNVTSVSSKDGQTLVIIDTKSRSNCILAGVAFDCEPTDPPVVYTEAELGNVMYALPFMLTIPEKVAKVECGPHFSVVLSTSGKAYSYGANPFGQLGQDHSEFNNSPTNSLIKAVRRPLPIKELVFEDDYVIDIAVGYTHCLALTAKQKVFLWGQGCDYPHNTEASKDMNLMGKDLGYPRELRGILIHYSPKRVLAGTGFSGIITTDGKLLTFGMGCSGQLGHLDLEGKAFGYLFIPKRVDFFDSYYVEDAAFGGSHALAIVRKKIKIDGTEEYKLSEEREVYSWGYNGKGQCGYKDPTNSFLPKKIETFNGHNVLMVSAGKSHSLFVAEKDGVASVYACGDAENGTSGLTKNLKGKFSEPTKLTLLDKLRKTGDQLAKIVGIEAGMNTSFAIVESS